MKKNYLLLVTVVSFLAACQKENDFAQQETKGLTLTATVEQNVSDSKTALGKSNTVVWSADDSVKVWNGTASEVFTIINGAGTGIATFKGNEIANPQYAFYPASAVSSISGATATFSLPAIQTYAANTFGKGANVAVAKISTGSMQFKNICGVLKLQLKGTTIVKSIKVTGKNNEKLNGVYTVDVSADGDPNVTFATTTNSAEKSVILDCGCGVALDPANAKNFYIVIPKGAFAYGFNLEITDIYSTNEYLSTGGNTINRNVILAMPEKSVNIKGDILPGEFTVSAAGDKIRFSRGNLIATLTDGVPTAWKFAENQYEYIGRTDANSNRTGNGDIDIFSYSTNGGDPLPSGYKPWGINPSTSESDYAGKFVDWATNSTLQTSLGNIWRTPSSAEMEFILNTRSVSQTGLADNSARYAPISIDGNYGLLLFPDTFSWDTETMGTAPTVFNSTEEINNPMSVTIQQFRAIENAGGVFICPCGYSPNNDSYHFVINTAIRGDYWYNDERNFSIYYCKPRFGAHAKQQCRAVRLVTSIN